MYYAIIAEDHPDSLERRKSVRPQHLERLEHLKANGRLLLAGPFPAIDSPDPGTAGFTGSLIVADFKSLQDAEHWAEQDPYKQNGVYKQVVVKPFRHVLP